MTADFPAMQGLARQIVAIEAARVQAAGTEIDEGVQVFEKLQVPLSRLAGPAGFASLLARAVAIAKAEVPALRVVQVRPDGSLAGFDEIEHDPVAGTLEMGRVTLLAHLLGLLATFIGEGVTRRLALDAWPSLSIDSSGSKREEKEKP